jgi:uncharacterized protein (DUF1499 family)
MNPWFGIAAALALLAAIVVAGFFLVGPKRVWRLLGPPDLGPVSFERLQRRSTPNDALACPPDICSARVDILSPVFAVSATELSHAFDKAIASEPRLTLVETTEQGASRRYIQRSRLMGFPDTIVVRFFERAGGHSTLALYSRSQLGKGDMGVNRARIDRWLEELRREALVVR